MNRREVICGAAASATAVALPAVPVPVPPSIAMTFTLDLHKEVLIDGTGTGVTRLWLTERSSGGMIWAKMEIPLDAAATFLQTELQRNCARKSIIASLKARANGVSE
jgi:hypothetical protein